MKKPKYRAKKTFFEGILFDSKKEAEFYGKLLLLKKAGEIKEIELQPKFKYEIQYYCPISKIEFPNKIMTKKAFYKADFRVTFANDEVKIYDVKGYKTAEYKRKKKIIEYLYDIEIFEV